MGEAYLTFGREVYRQASAAREVLGQQFRQVPNVIGDSRVHRRRHAQRAMNPAEVVIGEVQAVRGPQVLPLL